MKSHHLFLGIFCCFILFACNKDNDCDGTFVIESVVPDSNPPGTEIKIKGTGFSKDTEVRFAGQLAKADFSNEKGLVATIPSNVIGFVDLTVEEGDCLARTDFEVLGALPVNWVASPTVIIIPTLPAIFPDNINNVYKNYYDPNHTFGIFVNCDGINAIAKIADFAIENHTINSFLDNNIITGTYNCNEGTLEIMIDRSAKGGGIDTLDGIVISASTLGETPDPDVLYMLFTSRVTGRQIIVSNKN